MKKKLSLILSFFLLCSNLYSQGFAGLNAGNYSGITGVMLQPASIVDSRFKFDINLFSTDIRYSNNYFLLKRNAILKFNKNNFEDYPTFRSKYLSESKLAPGEKVFLNISNRTQLPLSFMMTLNKKSAIALNFQSRSMIQGRNISQDLAKLAFNSFYYQPLNNQLIDASGLTFRSLNWAEAGLTYGRVLFTSGDHFLKGAVTAKYLAGISSLNFEGNNLSLSVNSDSTFNFSTNRVNYNHNKNADFNKVFDSRFRPDANTFGFDAGLVYEYRGHLGNIKYIRNDDEKSYEVERRDLNKYIFKLGVSLLDVGMFNFDKPDNVNSFSANISNWDIRNARYSSLNEFDTALANRVTPLANDPRNYNVYLPGALSVQLDIRFIKGLYLNALAYRPLKIGNEAGSRFNNYGYYTITPRYERRHFGIYIPYTFFDREDISNFRDNQLGLTMKLGPLFFGSSNLGNMAFNKNLKAADFFAGLKIGFTYGKPTKITRLITTKEETDYDKILTEKENRQSGVVNIDTTAANRIIVDYSKGHVYSDGQNNRPVIIINNYYYNGNAAVGGRDTFQHNRNVVFNNNQPITRIDSAANKNLAQVRISDSVNRKLNDSLIQKRDQLDSLINRLYNLRQKLDSASKEDNSSGYNRQQNTVDDSMNEGKLSVNRPAMQRHQILNDDVYEYYIRQSARLQADIERLERQMAYNRSLAYSVAPPQTRTQPVYYNQASPGVGLNPVNFSAGRQTIRDTIVIRDTVFITKTDSMVLTKTDTLTTINQSEPATVIVTVPKETIIEEKIDYSKLPTENILFATGQATIRQMYFEKLIYLANILRKNPELIISIKGHTDKTGSPAVNELLSLKRANAVKSFFVRQGISETRMQLTAVAAEDPLVPDDTKNAHTQNRRVEIKILQ